MEDLNKNQIILLTLLISFVTSIATGIMTNYLLQEAPLEVTRNINRVVEKTIETVTTPGVVTPGQKEITTVVVKEEDQVLTSIDKNVKSIVRIKAKDKDGAATFYGIGLVVNKDGVIAADKNTILADNTYYGTFSDGSEFQLNPLGVDKQTNFIEFKVISSDKTKSYIFTATSFSDTEPKLGQTVIGLGGETENAVSVGRVVSLQTKNSNTSSSTAKTLIDIDTDLSTKDLVDGSPVFNLSGDIIGIKLSSDSARSFTPVSFLRKEISTW